MHTGALFSHMCVDYYGDSSVTCVTFRHFSFLKLQIHVNLLLTVLILIIALFDMLLNYNR